ncbi:MAG TPA: SCO2525 family SAM-dependent methyltransferase [Mycobacteriales bacterium]
MPPHPPQRNVLAVHDLSAEPGSLPDSTEPAERNADFPWDSFDSGWYLRHNYLSLRDDDRQIIKLTGEFLAHAFTGGRWHGIDVGTGTNLYPALAMLPLCQRITLREHAATNYEWISREVAHYSSNWDEFWAALAETPCYRKITDPRAALRQRATVERGSIFELPRSTWDVGTMFFVAESITHTRDEFDHAARCFVRSLKPGAPFVAAFMRNSQGYPVGTHLFPAVAITEADVRECLLPVADDVEIHHITSRTPLRDGYNGMMLANGRASRP